MGMITHIQRMSLHDGPGIRSTVFLKGCNMRCQWCHNPETFSTKAEIEWIADKCIHCLACVQVCPSEALIEKEGKLHFSKSKCSSCFACTKVCFAEAIHKIGAEKSAEELVEELLIDTTYFQHSKGGITLSGGEPMLQVEFCKEVLMQCKQKELHTAMETNLSYEWSRYKEILPFLDYLMVDLKLSDTAKHKQWTGIENTRIKDNLKRLNETGIPFEIRTPVVPTVNNTDQEMEAIANFVKTLNNCKKHLLLGYHSIGNVKYTSLGIDNPLGNIKDLPKEELEKYRTKIELLQANNIRNKKI